MQLNTKPPFLQLNPQKKEERYKLPLWHTNLEGERPRDGDESWANCTMKGLSLTQSRAAAVRLKALPEHLEGGTRKCLRKFHLNKIYTCRQAREIRNKHVSRV